MFTMINDFKFLKTEKGFIPFALTKTFTLREAPATIEAKWTLFNYLDYFNIEFKKKDFIDSFVFYNHTDKIVNKDGIYYEKEKLLTDINTAIDNALSLQEMKSNGYFPTLLNKLIVDEDDLRASIITGDWHGISLVA